MAQIVQKHFEHDIFRAAYHCKIFFQTKIAWHQSNKIMYFQLGVHLNEI